MITIRKSSQRGLTRTSWLTSYHSFSFGDYYDPANMGFHDLRVINDDYIAPGGGFPTHGHRDMEIITYIIEGELAHKDNLGNIETIKAGEVQRMTAGKGIMHSEFNASDINPVRLLQIWILPEQKNLNPGYEQRKFAHQNMLNQLCLIVSKSKRENSLGINQDADIYTSSLEKGRTLTFPAGPDNIWVQIISGNLHINDHIASQGDGISITAEKSVIFESLDDCHFLLFNMKSGIH